MFYDIGRGTYDNLFYVNDLLDESGFLMLQTKLIKKFDLKSTSLQAYFNTHTKSWTFGELQLPTCSTCGQISKRRGTI